MSADRHQSNFLIETLEKAADLIEVNVILETFAPSIARLSAHEKWRVEDAAQKRRGLLAQAPGPM